MNTFKNLNEKQQEQIMLSQGKATSIEMILRRIFNCDRFGFGGQVNSDRIRNHPFLSMTQGLAVLYERNPEKRAEINRFIEDFGFYEDMSIDYLLSFDTKEKTEEKHTIEIEKENGVEQLDYIIDCFRKIAE